MTYTEYQVRLGQNLQKWADDVFAFYAEVGKRVEKKTGKAISEKIKFYTYELKP